MSLDHFGAAHTPSPRSTIGPMLVIRTADIPHDLEHVRRLWLDYLSWGYDELEARHGFRLPVEDAVEHDVATIEKFEPPNGLLLLASEDVDVFGTGAMKRIGSETAESSRCGSIRRVEGKASAAPCWTDLSQLRESPRTRGSGSIVPISCSRLILCTAQTASFRSAPIRRARYRTSTSLTGSSWSACSRSSSADDTGVVRQCS